MVALEAGPMWERSDFIPDELESYAFLNHLGPKWNREPVLWEDSGSGLKGIGLGINMMNGVGGSTMHYSGHAWRLHPTDFKLRSTVRERYGEHVLEEGSTVVDWPIEYADLEPYYSKVERAIGVCGKAGVLRDPIAPTGVRLELGGNPYEGPRSDEYPMPPLRVHRLGQLMWTAGERLGYHPFMGPTAINSVDYDGRPASNYCGFCIGYGCRIDAKGSPHVTVLPKALWTGNLDIVPNATVVALDVGEGGRMAEVRFVHENQSHSLRAKVFFLCSYVFENVRLLLSSRNSNAPSGVANGMGLVGRHFMAHRYDSVGVLFRDEELNRFAGPQGQRVVIDDLNADNFDHAGLGFVAGAQIFAANEFHPIQDLAVVPPTRPAWGRAYKNFVRDRWNNLGQLLTNVEVLPHRDNYLSLDESRHGENGLALVKAVFTMHENEQRLVRFILDRMMELGYEAGAEECWEQPTALVPSQHDAGGTRMGESPLTSVVDGWCRCHEVPNLFILGPSTFPTSGGLNPSLTAQALAWRAAEHALSLL